MAISDWIGSVIYLSLVSSVKHRPKRDIQQNLNFFCQRGIKRTQSHIVISSKCNEYSILAK